MNHTTVIFDQEDRKAIEPGDATHYESVYGEVGNRIFFAFNSGDGELFGFLWPKDIGWISYSYFIEKQGQHMQRWTRGVGYLVLLHLFGMIPTMDDLQKDSLPFISAEGRLKDGWLNAFPTLVNQSQVG